MLIPFRQLAHRYGMKPKGVLHVGAHFGQEAPEYAAIGCNRMIFIEAIPEVYEKLKENIRDYPDAMAINVCISDKNEEGVDFHIANNEGQSSSLLQFGVHAVEHPDVVFTETRKVNTMRLDTLFSDKPLDCDLLNMDLQGAEMLALKSLGDRLNEFKWLYLEVNKAEVYLGCALIEEIDAYVGQFGFIRIETKGIGNFSWLDAFYARV